MSLSQDYFKEICGNCGNTFGSHHGGTSPYPRDYCPGHEGRMDWENGPGTCFSPTGNYKKPKVNKTLEPNNVMTYALGLPKKEN